MSSQDLRRLAIAFAIAIAIHEVIAALLPVPFAPRSAPRDVVAHVTIARVERILPSPTPRPTPTPTPPPVRVIVHAAAAQGAHAHIERIKHAGARRPTPPKSREATPIPVPIPTGGQGAGAQRGTGAGSLSTQEGTGNGTSIAGNGNGARICGAVDFEALGNPVYDPQTQTYDRSNIVAVVHYADGSSDRVPLDWTWRWPNEAEDPFNTSSDAPMLFQFPPRAQRASEPPAVQYIMAHTRPGGHTTLNDRCPNIPPPPSPNGPGAATPEPAPPPGG